MQLTLDLPIGDWQFEHVEPEIVFIGARERWTHRLSEQGEHVKIPLIVTAECPKCLSAT